MVFNVHRNHRDGEKGGRECRGGGRGRDSEIINQSIFYVCSHRGDIRQQQQQQNHIIIIYANFPTGKCSLSEHSI